MASLSLGKIRVLSARTRWPTPQEMPRLELILTLGRDSGRQQVGGLERGGPPAGAETKPGPEALQIPKSRRPCIPSPTITTATHPRQRLPIEF